MALIDDDIKSEDSTEHRLLYAATHIGAILRMVDNAKGMSLREKADKTTHRYWFRE